MLSGVVPAPHLTSSQASRVLSLPPSEPLCGGLSLVPTLGRFSWNCRILGSKMNEMGR